MGFIRTFLAISVVLGHSAPIHGFFGIQPDVAVRIFFIISGFYMSLVFSEKYLGASGFQAFYEGRFLRIFPIYYISLLFAGCAYYLIGGEAIKGWDFVESQGVSRLQGFFWVLPNMLLFGSDLPFLFHYLPGNGTSFSFGMPVAGLPEAVRISPSILNGPAWTLGIELWFYLLVPFLSKMRSRNLLLISVSSLIVLIGLEIQTPYSSYFFFPANLCFFIFGMISQRICRLEGCQSFLKLVPRQLIFIAVFAVMCLVLFRQYIPFYRNYGWMMYVLMVASLPLVFTVTKNLKIDRCIGDLSYPIYIFHAPIILILGTQKNPPSGGYTLLATLFISILIVKFVDAPLEKWRQMRVRSVLARS